MLPNTSKNTYDLTNILEKGKKIKNKETTVQDLQKEIKEVRLELKELKQKQKQDSEIIKLILENFNKNEISNESEENEVQNHEKIPEDFLFVLKEITSRKYILKITLVFSENFKINTIALFDTCADLNCIKSGLIPKNFQEKTNEKLTAANNSKQLIIKEL